MDSFTQPSVDNLLGNPVNLIPESLMTTIMVGFIVLNVVALLFFIVYLIGVIRKWKVESAVLSMQNDLADIKQLLHRSQPSSNQPEPVHTAVPAPLKPTSADEQQEASAPAAPPRDEQQ